MATKKEEQKGTEIAEKTESTEVAKTSSVPANVVTEGGLDISGDVGAGFEGAGAESFAIPFLQVLQKMSPLVDPDESSYIQGAVAGMFLDTVTRELYDGKNVGLRIIPCAYKRSYVKWGGRDSENSGFLGEFAVEEINGMVENGEIVEFEGKLYEPDADGKVNPKKSSYYADTRSHFVIVMKDNGEYFQAVLGLSSSQVKASKMLLTMLRQKKIKHGNAMITPPSFLNIVRLKTIAQSNEKGSWSGCQFQLEGTLTGNEAHIYQEAREMNAAFKSGDLQADFKKADITSADGGGDKPQDAEEF